MNRMHLLTTMLLASTPWVGPAAGQTSSLFHRETQASVQAAAPAGPPAFSLIAVPAPKPRAFGRHDLVTIIIREQATNTSSGDVSTERSTSINGSVDAWATLRSSAPFLRAVDFNGANPRIRAGLDREFDGSGSVQRSDSLTARITGEIIDVKPNGNLVIQASKEVVTDEDSYTITVTGVCRTADISPDNTVLSTQLSELTVVKKAAGTIRDSTKRGLFHRILDRLNLL